MKSEIVAPISLPSPFVRLVGQPRGSALSMKHIVLISDPGTPNRCGQTTVDELAELQRKYDHLQAENAALGVELSRLLAEQADLEAEKASLKAEQARSQGTELED